LSHPFGKLTLDKDFLEIQEYLSKNLYALNEAKTRVMRFLAQRQLNSNATSQILCLVGEPGVGKTFFAQTLAKAVGRNFGSIPIGSLSDSKVLRGSSGVYIGSEIGDIFQICSKTGTTNPLILLDEIDKIASSTQGGSASVISALLEIFDPLQQPFFKDNYINLPVDISKIWFIATANSVEKIHPALLDRMMTLHLPNYNLNDKLEIFDKYIWPDCLANSGLADIVWRQDAKTEFISKFPESGVRSLKNHTQDFCGMLAVESLTNQNVIKIITKKLVGEYIKDTKTWTKDKTISF
jgi:ATP-dependent Lon protease